MTAPKGTWEKVKFKSLGDARGELVAIEGNRHVPFEIKRVYYLIDTTNDNRRGFHAHRNLDQVLIALSGSCKVLVDDGTKKAEFLLDNPRDGLRITNLVWREMFEFTEDCVLVVLASDIYREEDYIRNYETFKKACRE